MESTTRHSPNAYLSRAAIEQDFGARAGGCAGSQDIVDEHNTLTIQARAGKQCKCLSHIFNSLAAREPGLRPRRLYSAEQAAFQRNLRRIAQSAGQALGLIELALSAFEGMKRHGHDEVP